MKRPPGIWILLSAGVLWLSLQDVYGIRATALIFGKSTTTTTTPGPVPNVTDAIEAEVVTETNSESNGKNASKPMLTGNPQLDYVHDPNLPKELNGYNLSEYPFYERVPDPEEIDFKCDGLHDGFYASIPYKCQVYHHCLFGTRYDFLCANYTAFDQKTFICQFVSDVDCVGSKKFWHRNDALYQAATTTTVKPLNIYTTTPPESPSLPAKAGGNPRVGGKRRRPILRRPQYDYYDDYADYEDYYEDRPRSNRRRRPRPRPRPIYDDEYDEEYEDEAYDRRNRRPYNRRGSGGRKNKKRNKNKELDEDYIDKINDRKKNTDDKEEVYRQNERRKPSRDSDSGDNRSNGKRKPQRYDNEDEIRRTPSEGDNFEDKNEKRKPMRDDDFEDGSRRPSRKNRRPSTEEDYDDFPKQRENEPKTGESDKTESHTQNEKPLIVPTTGTIYDRPRVAPRIKPPVPKNEANKYAYKPIKATTPSIIDDEEYYDEYEEDIPDKPSRSRKPQIDPISSKSSEIKERKQTPHASRNRIRATFGEGSSNNKVKTKLDEGSSNTNKRTYTEQEEYAVSSSPKKTNRGKDRYRSRLNSNPTESIPETEQEFSEQLPKKNKIDQQNRNTSFSKKFPDPEYYDSEYDLEKTKEEISSSPAPRNKWRPSESVTSSTTPNAPSRKSTTKPSPMTEIRRERPEQFVRIVKRPFLPSRGGNPYVARGLHPVGFKAREEIGDSQNANAEEISKTFYTDELQPLNSKPKYSLENQPSSFEMNGKSNPKMESNIRIEPQRQLAKSKFTEPISEDDDDFKPIRRPLRPSYDNNYGGPRTTQKPKVPGNNPLDINEQEYDITLNDALNPTLPNLPQKTNFPTGFSPANDYTFSAFHRPRYVIEPILSSANTEYAYQSKQPAVRQQFETVPQTFNTRGEYLPNSNYYPQIVESNVKGVVQTQAQPYY